MRIYVVGAPAASLGRPAPTALKVPRQLLKEKDMARPKRHPSEKRSERYNLRFTVAEIEHVRQQAEAAGLETAEYLRRRCLGHKITSATVCRADPALVTEINRLGQQLSGLGNVTNQVALYLHTDRRIPADWEVLPQEIKKSQKQVSQVLDQVVLSLD